MDKAVPARLAPFPILVTKVELADAFGVNVSTIERWQTEGKIKACYRTPGGSPRFWYPPLEAYES